MESGDGPNAITGPSGHAPPHPHHGLPSGGFSVAPHPPPFYGDSMKLTRGHSCVLCQQRKVRCDKQKPCANCVKAGAECKVIPPQPPRRRRKKPLERDLIGQLKKYETLLAQNGIKFDPIADDLKPGDIHSEDVNDLGQNLGGLKTSPESSTAADYEGGGGDKNMKYMPYFKEYRHQDIQDSSDEEYEGPTIHHAFDTMFGENDGFPFIVGGGPSSVTDAHPSPIQILQLWQVYISNVNPLLKISHVTTLQGEIIGSCANLAKLPKPLEALMFGIYFIAVTSMKEPEVQAMFGEDRSVLLARYQTASMQSLVNAGFMRSTELMVLQALFLYLLGIRQYTDPRTLFCLIGIAVRIANRLGLHRDGAQFGVSPFDTEQRRRLWWQLVMFDKRIAEITGSSITALSASGGDCKMPLNLNDTDLNVHAKEPPPAYIGPTEMLFALCRIELTVAGGPGGNVQRPNTTPQSGPQGTTTAKNKHRVNYSPSPASPDVVSQVANLHLPQNLDGFCNYIETVYLKHCDSKIPLHYFTMMLTRQALCKLRVIDFMSRGISTDTLEQPERDALFSEAMRMVEYDNLILSNEALGGYMWYMMMHFPFPAYLFLISELRLRRTGELCDRAWDVMIENHERRGITQTLKSPVHIAFGSMFLKAWDVREQAEAQLGRQIEVPKLIYMLRERASRMAPAKRPLQQQQQTMPGRSGSQQQPQQQQQQQQQAYQQQPEPSSSSSASPNTGGMGSSQQMQQQVYSTPESTESQQTMGMDQNMMFGGLDGGPNPMYGGGGPQDMIMNEFQPGIGGGGLDWNYLMQYSGFGGYGGQQQQQQMYPAGTGI